MNRVTGIISCALFAATACTAPIVPAPGCEPGAAVACACLGDLVGVQTCSSDGTSYSACVCSVGSGGGSAAGGSGGGSQAGGGQGGGAFEPDAGTSQNPTLLEGADLLAFEAAVEACGVPEAGHIAITSNSEMRAALIGIWASCNGPFWTQRPDECGEEFASDGQWHLLTCPPGGLVLRQEMPGLSGPWELLVSSPHQVNVYPMPDAEKILLPEFSGTPHKMAHWPEVTIWARGH